MIAIEIESLTKSFGSFVAVNNVSMEVRQGEFMGLLGPNGAGKTTILKVLSGMIKPSSGTAKVDGYDCKVHHKAMRNVGCVIETPECYSNFTPVEVLKYIGNVRGIKRNEIGDRIRFVLEEVRMEEWRNEHIGTFSKGMKQRVALAQALLSDPDILILDEPTSGLDPRGMVEIREILIGLKKGGKTMLISSHMLNEVSELCDSVTMIRQGQVVVSGNVKELLNSNVETLKVEIQVKTRMTDEFLTDLLNTYGANNVEIIDDYSFVITSTEKNASDAALDLVKKYDLGLMSVRQKGSDLESLYMSMTEGVERHEVR